jgi:hypothetical protein
LYKEEERENERRERMKRYYLLLGFREWTPLVATVCGGAFSLNFLTPVDITLSIAIIQN